MINPQALTWLNRFLFAVFRSLPGVLGTLHRLRIIHFARWVLLPADRWPGAPQGWRTRHGYMLFASNFNSAWDVYLDEFSDILAVGLDALWYWGTGFPKSVPSTPFKAYIDHNSLDAGYYYNATPAHSVRDVHNAFYVRRGIAHLERLLQELDADPALSEADREARFEAAFDQVFRGLANRLPSPGRAPLADSAQPRLNEERRRRIRQLEALRQPFGFLPRAGVTIEPGGGHAQL
ncbi:MAG: hypothetical protein ACO3EF_00345 [Vulcanococcus sp.]